MFDFQPDKCGKGGNAADCGERCYMYDDNMNDDNYLDFEEEEYSYDLGVDFYCNKGEHCCPIPPNSEVCSETCGPFDAERK